MGKLHEILAVEKDAAQKCNKIFLETVETFSKRQDHFSGLQKKYMSFDDGDRSEEEALSESKEIVSTVMSKLRYTLDAAIQMLDIKFQKDMANRKAGADIVVGDKVIIADVPAVTLLMLEDALKDIRNVVNAIPTLEPGIKWVPAKDIGEEVFMTAAPEVRIRTRKETVYKELSKPTDRHPAQFASEQKDVPIGKYEETKYSSRISPAQKMHLLRNIETLTAAVKKARARANEQEVGKEPIGEAIVEFLLKL
jgi:hypothetical protein